MRNPKKPSGLRRRLYLVYHQDGMLELVIGLCLLILAAVILSEQFAFIGLIAIPAAMYLPLKQSVSLPRVGHIRFVSEDISRQRLGLAVVVGLAVFVGLLALYIVAASGALSSDTAGMIRNSLPIMFAVSIGVALAGVAYALNHARFYFFGTLGLILILAFYVAGGRIGISVALLGVVIEVTGLVNLVSFLRKYPINGESLNE